jgi:hypothetical protein
MDSASTVLQKYYQQQKHFIRLLVILAIIHHFINGFVGVSTQTNLVFSLINDLNFSMSFMSTKWNSIPESL